jgi:hypothetical protein
MNHLIHFNLLIDATNKFYRFILGMLLKFYNLQIIASAKINAWWKFPTKILKVYISNEKRELSSLWAIR